MGKRGKQVAVWSIVVVILLLLGGCGSASNDAASNSLAYSGAANKATSSAESEMDGEAPRRSLPIRLKRPLHRI